MENEESKPADQPKQILETREYLKQLARPEHQSYHPIRGKLDEESSRMTRDATTKNPEHVPADILLPTEDKQGLTTEKINPGLIRTAHDNPIENNPSSLLHGNTELDKKDETTTEKRILQGGSRIARDVPHENVSTHQEHEFPADLLRGSVGKQETTTEKRVRRLADSSSSSSSSEEDGYQGEEEIEKRKDNHRHTRNTPEDKVRKGSKHIPVAHPATVSNQHQDKRHRREIVREIP